jgi:hypothetical protein
LAAWLKGQSTPVRNQIVVLAAKLTGQGAITVEAFCAWMGEPLDCFAHVGRCLQARGIIDYVVESHSDWQVLEQEHESRLRMLDSHRMSEGAKDLVRGVVGRDEEFSEQWQASATSWKELCQSTLGNDALRAWEEAQRLQEVPCGSPP